MLDNIDKKILKVLEGSDIHTSEIAREIKLPRTTISYRLNRLQENGSVSVKTSGRKKVWSLDFNSNNSNLPIQVFNKDNFYDIYLELLNIPPKSVVVSVQGVSAGKSEINNLPKSLIFKVHEYFKKNNIVLKGVSNTKLLDVIGDLKDDYIKSHYGRGSGIRLLKNDLFLESGEVIATNDFVVITNPEQQIAILIKDVAISKIIYQTLHLLFDYTDEYGTTNLNSYFERGSVT